MTTEVLGNANPEAPEPSGTRWIPDDARFGARLALVRQRMGWGNVKEAAEACGIPVQSWRTWERDNVQPRGYEGICRQIAGRTGCDLDWLMRGKDGGADLSSCFGARSVRPMDNRPAGGPRKLRPLDKLRRPRRTQPAPGMVPLRRAA